MRGQSWRIFQPSSASANNREGQAMQRTIRNVFEGMTKDFLKSTFGNGLFDRITQLFHCVYLLLLTIVKKSSCHALCCSFYTQDTIAFVPEASLHLWIFSV